MNFVQRLPIPYGLTYLALFAAQVLAHHVLAWIDGWLPLFTLNSMAFLFPVWLWLPLALITYLDSVAVAALANFCSLLDISPEAVQRLKYEFTTMPARNVILSSLFWVGVYGLVTYAAYDSIYVAFGFGPLLTPVVFFQGLAAFAVGSVVYYHTLRQLRLVNRTVRLARQFDLFRLEPVYAFSTVTARTGVAWIVLLSLTLLCYPIQVAAAPALSLLVIQIVLALAAFALPLLAVNQRLVAEKRRLLAEHDLRAKAVLASLNHCVAENGLANATQLKDALTSIDFERQILARIPTWPWRPGLFASFLSVAVLPILLFLVQLVLGNLLSK
jgi:hypothetical protein